HDLDEETNPAEERIQELKRIKTELHHQLVTGMDLAAMGSMEREQLQKEVRRVADAICQRSSNLLSRQERDALIEEVLDETFGLGPLEPLMRDPGITDILINGPATVYVERNGRMERTSVSFNDDRHLLHIIQ